MRAALYWLIMMAAPAAAASQGVATSPEPSHSLVGAGWHRGLLADPFNDDTTPFVTLQADSVVDLGHTKLTEHDTLEMPLMVMCMKGKIRVRAISPLTALVTDPSNTHADLSPLLARFSDGETWTRYHYWSVYPSKNPMRSVLQPHFYEQELVQHMMRSSWMRLGYSTGGGLDIVAYYTVPNDTRTWVSEVYGECKKKPPN